MNLNDLFEAVEKLKSLPPIATNIEMYYEGYMLLTHSCKKLEPCSHFKTLLGLNIIVKNYIEGVKRNEGKILYSDGTSKIIKIFNISEENINGKED